MTVDQLLAKIAAAFPAFNAKATEALAPVYRARLDRHAGPLLARAYIDTLGSFTVKTSKALFPMPADFEAHLPSGRLDLGKDDGPKIDFDARNRRAAALLADWKAGQGARAAAGVPEVMRALEFVARQMAERMAWHDNPKPLLLTRAQVKAAQQSAISILRRDRYGKPPLRPQRWWQQIFEVAADLRIEVTPEWWGDETARTLAQPEEIAA